ncbi:MAG TPA: O-antigen ligase family protein, partial [Anaerolineae bacterium]|nr:O-antigen ligase family protein [Anaerolineae bacterium]
ALPPDWTGPPSLWGQCDAATQAAYTVAALERARREWPWAGALVLENLQPAGPSDDPRWGFALWEPDGRPRPVYRAVVEWNGALPDGAPPGGYGAVNRWADYTGGWRLGPAGADPPPDGGQAVFRFTGSGVALTVRREPQRAFLYVAVDGAPANRLPQDETGRAYVVLYDDSPTVAVVPLADGLPYGLHTVTLTVAGGAGHWPLVEWRVSPPESRAGYTGEVVGLSLAALFLALFLTHAARRFPWEGLRRRFLDAPDGLQAAVVALAVALFWASAAATWGRTGDGAGFYLLLGTSIALLPPLTLLLAWRPVWGLAAVALAAPFYLCPAEMFYRALGLAEVLVLLLSLGLARRLKATVADCAPVGAWLLTAVIAGLAAHDHRAALFELRTVFLMPALYYCLFRAARPTVRERRTVLVAWLIGGLLVAVIGLAEYALGRNVVLAEGVARLRSVYHSPNSAALYLERVWPLLLAVAVGGRGRRRWAAGLALLVVTAALGLTFSRGALLLALPAAVLAMGWWAGGRYRRAAMGLVLVGLLLLLPLLHVPRFAGLLDLRRGSTFFRLQVWRSTLTLLREHPLFGIGPGNFQAAYRTRYVLPSAWEEFDLDQPHDIYLDHWARLGAVGPFVGLWLLATFLRAARRERRRSPVVTAGLVGGVAAMLA